MLIYNVPAPNLDRCQCYACTLEALQKWKLELRRARAVMRRSQRVVEQE